MTQSPDVRLVTETRGSALYATAAQGDLADSAVQPGDLGTAAAADTGDFATAAQGTKADGAAQKASNLSDLASAQTARANLGLGSALRVWATGDPDPTAGGTVPLPTGVRWAIVKATADTLPSWVPAGSLLLES